MKDDQGPVRSTRLTIYLMREDVVEFDMALDGEKRGVLVELSSEAGIDGRFYYVPPQPSAPSWISFVQPIFVAPLDVIRTSSVSGLLLLRVSGRMFAFTFGYGRSLLDLGKIEYQFGLRVALNLIDPRQIRSLDTKTFEDIVVSTNTQVSRSAELPTFGVDVSSDILRAVTGEPRDKTFAKRLSGSDALVMNVETKVTNLPVLCAELLSAFKEDTYKVDFGWIDQLAIVRDGEFIDTLDQKLVDQLIGGDLGTTHLAMPESISWEDIDAFKIGGTRRHVYDDLDLAAYLEQLGGDRAEITIGALKSRPVSVRFSRSEEFDQRWRLYQCIVTEQRSDGRLYVLIEGRWFAVDDSLVGSVDSFLSSLPESRVSLIPAAQGESESTYNERLSQSAPDHYLKMDARIKRPGGAASGIELCDVFTDQGDFIHVKRKSRSSTLSHLFAQGTVSATTFLGDGHFRDEIRKVIEEQAPEDSRGKWLALIPTQDQQVDRSVGYRVTYVVVVNSVHSGADWLPFFSKLNLMQHGRQLQSIGFQVSLARVDVDPIAV